eukprot:scaffold38227_cov18-Prasinocladus_malaysianus.AAC.1
MRAPAPGFCCQERPSGRQSPPEAPQGSRGRLKATISKMSFASQTAHMSVRLCVTLPGKSKDIRVLINMLCAG